MRIRDPKTTTLIFASGKMVITGAKSAEQARLAGRKHARIVQKAGFASAKFTDFKVQNFVGSLTLGFYVRLEGLHVDHYHFTRYEPEIFPGLIYRIAKPRVVALVFANGKVVLTGAKKVEDMEEAWRGLKSVLLDYKL